MRSRHVKIVMIAAVLAVSCAAGCGSDGPGDDSRSAGRWKPTLNIAEDGWVLSVAGASASDVYAVGGTPERGRVWHFDGDSWTEQVVPDGVALLNWVHVFDDGTPVIAGDGGAILSRRSGKWTVQATPTDHDLWGVWGSDSTHVWAVGGNGRDPGAATVIRRRAGSRWQAVDVPDLERPNVRAFFKVWGAGADNVYIVGQRGAVLHWDGAELSELLVGTSRDLISVWGTGADNIVIVGGRSNGVAVHFDGSDWTVASLAPAAGINGVWMGKSDTAWMAGNAGTLGRLEIPEMTLDTDDVDVQLDLHAVFGVDGHRFAVGGNFGTPQGPYHGVAVGRSEAP